MSESNLKFGTTSRKYGVGKRSLSTRCNRAVSNQMYFSDQGTSSRPLSYGKGTSSRPLSYGKDFSDQGTSSRPLSYGKDCSDQGTSSRTLSYRKDFSDQDTSTTNKHYCDREFKEPIPGVWPKRDFDKYWREDRYCESFNTDPSSLAWAVFNVNSWLEEQGFGRYAGLFEKHGVDEETLPLLTFEDLKEMGVLALGPRRKLYNAIRKLRDEGGSVSDGQSSRKNL